VASWVLLVLLQPARIAAAVADAAVAAVLGGVVCCARAAWVLLCGTWRWCLGRQARVWRCSTTGFTGGQQLYAGERHLQQIPITDITDMLNDSSRYL